MITFTPLASSSAGCCYHVTSGEHPGLLIDAGISFKEIQRALNFRVSSLAGCLISHAHGDHSKAVKDLLKAGVDCWASPETWLALDPDGRLLGHRRRELRMPGLIGHWVVTPFEAVHDEPGTLGFVIDHVEGGRLVYLTDSAYSIPRFEGVTIFALECNFDPDILKANAMAGRIDMARAKRTIGTHMSIDRLIELLQANDLSRCEQIWLLHLSDANSDEEDFRARVQAATGCPTYVAGKRMVTA